MYKLLAKVSILVTFTLGADLFSRMMAWSVSPSLTNGPTRPKQQSQLWAAVGTTRVQSLCACM